MKVICLSLTIVLSFVIQGVNAQDTTYVGMYIDGKEIILNEEFKLEVKQNRIVSHLPIIGSEYFIHSIIHDSIIDLIVSYDTYRLIFKNLPASVMKNRITFYIEDFPFQKKNKFVFFNKRNTFKYYYTLSANFSRIKMDENNNNGFLYSVLRSKKMYKGRRNNKK
ncbi:MAG TPA: hypothetical protein VMV56_07095 [Williamwhitmania sp.]|nr:hypothetical protein [Williamwhitmania sp.]